MPSERAITPHATADPLVCAEFRQRRGYTNWRPRGTADWLLIYTLAGAGRITAEGREWRLGEGQALLYRPGTPHDYATDPAAGHWTLRWAHFVPKPHWQPWLLWPEAAHGIGCVQLGAEATMRVGEALNRMIVASRLGGAGAPDLAMNALEEALIWSYRTIAGDRWVHLDPRIHRAIAYLAAHPSRPFSLPELARRCGLSPSRLSHLFKQEVQVTPRAFSEQLRLELAGQLLRHTGLTVGEVAAAAGFVDPLYFSRRFTRAHGRSPAASRPNPRRG